MTEMVAHIRYLAKEGVTLLAWSSGGGEYARESARELGIEPLFTAFLPKPNLLLDDQPIGDWHRFIQVHPASAATKTSDEYRAAVFAPPA